MIVCIFAVTTEIILKESQDNRRKHKWLTVKK